MKWFVQSASRLTPLPERWLEPVSLFTSWDWIVCSLCLQINLLEGFHINVQPASLFWWGGPHWGFLQGHPDEDGDCDGSDHSKSQHATPRILQTLTVPVLSRVLDFWRRRSGAWHSLFYQTSWISHSLSHFCFCLLSLGRVPTSSTGLLTSMKC